MKTETLRWMVVLAVYREESNFNLLPASQDAISRLQCPGPTENTIQNIQKTIFVSESLLRPNSVKCQHGVRTWAGNVSYQ